MRQYVNLISFLFLLIFTACNESSSESTKIELRVIESKIEFNGKAGEGSILIEVESDRTIEVKTSNAWCKVNGDIVTVEGNKRLINLSAIRNPTLASRSSLITISDGVTSQVVCASQAGSIFYADDNLERRFNNDEQTFKIDIVSSVGYKVDIVNDWLSVNEQTDDFVEIKLTKNTTGKPRVAVVSVVGLSGISSTYAIYQYEGMDLINTYIAQAYVEWKYAGASGYIDLTNSAVSKNSDGSYNVRFTMGLTEKITFNISRRAVFDKNALLIESNQYQPGQDLALSETESLSTFVICGDDEGLKLNNFRIGLAPSLVSDTEGNVFQGLMFKEEDKPAISSNAYMSIAFFTSPDNPGNDTYVSEMTIIIPAMLFVSQD